MTTVPASQPLDPLRVVFVTQDEPFYLPIYLEQILKKLDHGIEVLEIYAVLANIPGKGFWGTLRYYLEYFGPIVFAYMVYLRVRYMARTCLNRWRHRGALHAVAAVGQRFSIKVTKVKKINAPEVVAQLKSLRPHVIFSLACPQLFRGPLLAIPSHGCMNIHSSLLPKFKGINANFWALQRGETNSGVTIHYMNERIDDGAILAQTPIPIQDHMSLHDLYLKVIESGSSLAAATLARAKAGDLRAMPTLISASEASYFSFPTKDDVKAFRRRNRRFFRYL